MIGVLLGTEGEVYMKRTVFGAAFVLLAAALPVGASTFIEMSRADLVRQSAAAVQGKILKTSSFWDAKGQVILTEALVQVEDVVFGKAATVVVVRTFGGTVDGYTIEAHGFPRFTANERVLLFLGAEANGASQVIGYQQGQFRLVKNAAGIEFAVPMRDGEARILRRDGRAAAPAGAVRLDALRESIRAEAARAGRLDN
jgi:hypothetical protein